MENVANTGMGVISSLGLDTDSIYRGLAAAHVAVAPAPWAGDEGIEYAWISPVKDFRPEDWMEERVARHRSGAAGRGGETIKT